MDYCEPILGLVLDNESEKAIKRIRAIPSFGNMLAGSITSGVFISLFANNNPPVASYNIVQADWKLYSEAMRAIPLITKRLVEREIDTMYWHYQMPGNRDHKHEKFWRGLKNGCKLQ